ncbi:Carboxypeptidase B2 [Manis pentadactyla]|nr:Carboxypeptidase B2 [Manis pentadactyla]
MVRLLERMGLVLWSGAFLRAALTMRGFLCRLAGSLWAASRSLSLSRTILGRLLERLLLTERACHDGAASVSLFCGGMEGHMVAFCPSKSRHDLVWEETDCVSAADKHMKIDLSVIFMISRVAAKEPAGPNVGTDMFKSVLNILHHNEHQP